jgi:hypothetical protein
MAALKPPAPEHDFGHKTKALAFAVSSTREIPIELRKYHTTTGIIACRPRLALNGHSDASALYVR